jgi:hypothetical protein
MVVESVLKKMSILMLTDEIFSRFAQGTLSKRENLKVAWHLAHSEEARKRLSDLVPNGDEILAGLGLNPASGVQRKRVVRRRPKPRRYEEDTAPGSPLLRFVRGEMSHRENVKLAWRLMNSSALRRELAELPGGSEVLAELLGGLRPDLQAVERSEEAPARPEAAPAPEQDAASGSAASRKR